jgi:hypothetical protein
MALIDILAATEGMENDPNWNPDIIAGLQDILDYLNRVEQEMASYTSKKSCEVESQVKEVDRDLEVKLINSTNTYIPEFRQTDSQIIKFLRDKAILIETGLRMDCADVSSSFRSTLTCPPLRCNQDEDPCYTVMFMHNGIRYWTAFDGLFYINQESDLLQFLPIGSTILAWMGAWDTIEDSVSYGEINYIPAGATAFCALQPVPPIPEPIPIPIEPTPITPTPTFGIPPDLPSSQQQSVCDIQSAPFSGVGGEGIGGEVYTVGKPQQDIEGKWHLSFWFTQDSTEADWGPFPSSFEAEQWMGRNFPVVPCLEEQPPLNGEPIPSTTNGECCPVPVNLTVTWPKDQIPIICSTTPAESEVAECGLNNEIDWETSICGETKLDVWLERVMPQLDLDKNKLDKLIEDSNKNLRLLLNPQFRQHTFA